MNHPPNGYEIQAWPTTATCACEHSEWLRDRNVIQIWTNQNEAQDLGLVKEEILTLFCSYWPGEDESLELLVAILLPLDGHLPEIGAHTGYSGAERVQI